MRTPLNALAAAVLLVSSLLNAAPEQSQRGSDTPISVIASTTGRFVGERRSWHLSVNSAGRAHLTIYTLPKPQTREFNITPEQIKLLSELLEKEQFFDLKADYGYPPGFDTSTDKITIVRGEFSRTVSIHDLMDWVHNDPSKLKEPARAVRVFQLVRGWFDDKDAVNREKYYDMVLKAAEKGG